jgi:hypothetical protein
MASYLPPTDTLPIFENSVFETNNTTALTYADAKKLFITFPTAQATSTIADFISGSISYITPSSGSFFNIGTNQVSGGTIRIGPTGTSGVSVHAGNIDCNNSTINNATSATLNNLSLGNLQTSGVLNIGTGSRVTTGNGGAINIGTGASSVGPVNIGVSTCTTSVNGPLSVIGSQTSTGLITANGGLTSNGTVTLSTGVISGNTASEVISNTFTIGTNPINRDYYLFCNNRASTYTITLPSPATRSGQVIHIRNFSSQILSITTPSGTIYPTISTGSNFTTWTAFANNTAQNFLSDGTNWLGF